jgi:hypothetical protein
MRNKALKIKGFFSGTAGAYVSRVSQISFAVPLGEVTK